MKVVAKALIQNPDKKSLFLYRGMTHPNFPGHLDLPGGEIEKDEEWVDAVVREISEETALQIDSGMLETVLEKHYSDVIHVLFIATIPTSSPQVTLSWEHMNFEWLTNEELLQKELPARADRYYLDVLEYLKTAP